MCDIMLGILCGIRKHPIIPISKKKKCDCVHHIILQVNNVCFVTREPEFSDFDLL